VLVDVDVTVAVVCFGERARTLTPFAYLSGYRGKQMGCPEVERSSLPTPAVILIAWPPPPSVANPRRCWLD